MIESLRVVERVCVSLEKAVVLEEFSRTRCSIGDL